MSSSQDSAFHIVRIESADGASLGFCRHGGHLVSFCPADGEEVLFMSERAVYAEGSALRGGVPIVFPQFADRGPLPKHGFARTRAWTLVEAEREPDGSAVAILRLVDDMATRAIWDRGFELTQTIRARGDSMEQTLEVRARGERLEFTCALHTYFAVDELEHVELGGLESRRYEDSADGGRAKTADAEALRFGFEIDRLYAEPAKLELVDGRRKLVLESEGFSDWVVWNPGEAKAGKLGDLGEGQWRSFVCVEAARVSEEVVLEEGERWRGRMKITARAKTRS